MQIQHQIYKRPTNNSELLKQSLIAELGSREGFGFFKVGHANKEFVFCDPVAKIIVTNGSTTISSINSQESHNQPWKIFEILDEFYSQEVADLSLTPFACGFISYEFSRFIENVPHHLDKDFPDACFYLYSRVIEFHKGQHNEVVEHVFEFEQFSAPIWKCEELSEKLCSPYQVTNSSNITMTDLAEASEVSSQEYMNRVEHIRSAILEGEVYQVNYSQEFCLPLKKRQPWQIMLASLATSPADYSGYLELGNYSIVSASPELFFYQNDSKILCSPIKGTRPRGSDATSDQELKESLTMSEKDRAELAMIVDLVRNDLGRIAELGSVKVLNHARVSTLPQVHHLVSDIEAELSHDCRLPDIIRALFPCGSITGTPKIAAMKFIHELEPGSRRIYTGSFGCLGPNKFTCLNVAIRTGYCHEDKFVSNAGGGVVIDSEPLSEYEESLAKATSLFSAWKSTSLQREST